MHDELFQFQRNDVWTLVPRPKSEHINGTKWIFFNKTDEEARLVAHPPVAHMESIRILLTLACHLRFKLYQMDVKTAFLNGLLKEDVYMDQPKGFIDPHFSDNVLYLKNALYGLKQAFRAWYDRLIQYLVSYRFTRGKANQTLFINREGDKLILAQVYVDDIIFGSTKDELTYNFSKLMHIKFEISMIREITHFLGLRIFQQDSSIFLS